MTPNPQRPWEVAYNGTSWADRCAVTPIQNAAIRSGKLQRPTVCSICGDDRAQFPQGRDYRYLHTERYDRPLEIYPCCKRCHAALHARFRDPERWQAVLRRFGRPEAWFVHLSLDPASQWRPFAETYPKGLPGPNPLRAQHDLFV